MSELEDKIRTALHDPRWALPAWPDPMRRVRRAAARQRARLGAAAVAALAAVVTPLALLTGPTAHGPGVKSPKAGMTVSPSSRSSKSRVPSWAKDLPGAVAYLCGDYICLMRPDGSGKRTLNGTFPEGDVAWSPDGSRLAFRGYYGLGDGQYDLYVVHANGCRLTRLTHRVNGVTPSWSPTGHQIAFAVGGINVINADGTGLRHLTTDRTPSGRYRDDEQPAWSPGNRIAFVRVTRASRGQIYLMNPSGSGLVPLTHGSLEHVQPSWSPGGRAIAFVTVTSRLNPSGVIDVANANGTGLRQVSPAGWVSYSPTWTPGGKIVFLRQTGAATQFAPAPTSAYIVSRDGSGLRLLYPRLNARQLTWGPAALPKAGC